MYVYMYVCMYVYVYIYIAAKTYSIKATKLFVVLRWMIPLEDMHHCAHAQYTV